MLATSILSPFCLGAPREQARSNGHINEQFLLMKVLWNAKETIALIELSKPVGLQTVLAMKASSICTINL
jgi:hypothetical protein